MLDQCHLYAAVELSVMS